MHQKLMIAEPLYKILGKKSPRVERVGAVALKYEEVRPEYKTSGPKITHDHEVGIEVEVEGITDGGVNVIDYPVWTIKEDGSLRNHGYEFVSSPIRGDRVTYALNKLYTGLNKGYVFSPRTSIHVHVNILDLTLPQIASVLVLNLAVEKLLYRFVGGDRDKNNFCVPFGETNYLTGLINDLVEGKTTALASWAHVRYLGLNIDSIHKFGTLEFRHMGGTDDITKVGRWINLIGAMKTFAEKNEFSQVLERIKELNTYSNYRKFLDDVFGEHSWLLGAWDNKTLMEKNVSIIKRIVTKNELMDQCKKEYTSESEWVKRLHPKKEAALYFNEYEKKTKLPRDGRTGRLIPTTNWTTAPLQATGTPDEEILLDLNRNAQRITMTPFGGDNFLDEENP